ncbi:hypothetical protein [Ideonella sp. YS5]|uniref:hypothetical protein n=1 Tax=Ideonella sp. YS5 TaxID=3453714 RepID=UPI003EEAE6A2
MKLGFCWIGFFLPGLWAMSEGLWRPFAFTALFFKLMSVSENAAAEMELRSLSDIASLLNIAAALSALAYLLTMLFCGLFGKRWLVARLRKQGYVERS